jgi:acyl-homoserine-lactone acylase
MSIDETPGVLNPPNGWVYNSNNWPWSAAGPNSPKRENYPPYVDRGNEESARGVHAIRVLQNKQDFTLDSLIAAAFDPQLPAFDTMLPPLFKAYDGLPDASPLKAKVAGQIAVLRAWDHRWGVDSVATTLANSWGERTGARVDRATPDELVQALAEVSDALARDFGTWKTPWGEVNRFQRLTGDIVQPFSDAGPSIPVGFTSSRWGSLAAFGARTYKGTKKMYGTSGNSFVAVVEFGDRVRAKAVTAGGESGDPASPHFNDQAKRYCTGDLREVYFYPAQLRGHTERQYHPGQ